MDIFYCSKVDVNNVRKAIKNYSSFSSKLVAMQLGSDSLLSFKKKNFQLYLLTDKRLGHSWEALVTEAVRIDLLRIRNRVKEEPDIIVDKMSAFFKSHSNWALHTQT